MSTETNNVTDITPLSTETNNVTDITPSTDDDTDTPTYRVLRRDENTVDGVTRWLEEDTIDSRYTPDATQIGEMFGEGDYLLIELDSRYSFHSTYQMRVVAEKRYREAREDDES